MAGRRVSVLEHARSGGNADAATGFYAATSSDFATAFAKVFDMTSDDTLNMRKRARSSAKRFTEEAFAKSWIVQMERLVKIEISRHGQS